jgi:outer membrane immunogenic protein
MRNLTVATSAVALLLGLGGNAFADGMISSKKKAYAAPAAEYVPTNTWTGFYIGANGGYGWDARDGRDYIVTDLDKTINNTNSFAGYDRNGGFGGGQIGYNFGSSFLGIGLGSQFVIGIEADLQASDIGDEYRANAGGGATGSVRTNIDWFGTVRGRVGYAMDTTLFYFTGGFAFGGINDRIVYDDQVKPVNSTATFRKDETETGYVLGGGIEQKFSPSVSLKFEYQYIDLGSDRYSAVSTPEGNRAVLTTTDHDFHTFRVGLNYHFNKSYEPLK